MMMMGYGWWGILFMLLFWGGIIVMAILVVARLFPRMTDTKTSKGTYTSEPAEEILRQRFARGEITQAEFNEMRAVLRLQKDE